MKDLENRLEPALVLPPILGSKQSIDGFMKLLLALEGLSDVLVQTDDYVWCKLHGVHTRATDRIISGNEMDALLWALFNQQAQALLAGGRGLDWDVVIKDDAGVGWSLRANSTSCYVGDVPNAYSITMRRADPLPRPFESLRLEAELCEALFPAYGLVIVVGITGSGKTTILRSTLRAWLEGDRPVKITTYEQPREGSFGRLGEGRMPLVSQVEIGEGRNLSEFKFAAPNAMRRGCDVLVLGEMRDPLSGEAGLEFATTGHAVYATMHTETPGQTAGRLVGFFPVDAQPSVANKFMGAVRVIVAQKQFSLRSGGTARVRSWVVMDRALRGILQEHPFTQWEKVIDQVVAERGASFEDGAFPYLQRGEIDLRRFSEIAGMTLREAREYCDRKGWRGHGV